MLLLSVEIKREFVNTCPIKFRVAGTNRSDYDERDEDEDEDDDVNGG